MKSPTLVLPVLVCTLIALNGLCRVACEDKAHAGGGVPQSLEVSGIAGNASMADTSPDSDSLRLGNVVVVTRTDLAELSSSTFGEALAMYSGLYLTATGSLGSPQMLSMRGGRAREIVFLLDGVPVSDPQMEVADLNWLPLAGLSRVETIKGGTSSTHGSSAVSGAANVVSIDAMPEIPWTRFATWWGSFDSRAVSLNFRRLITNRFGILGVYENSRSGGWIEDTAFEGEKFFGKISGVFGNHIRFDIVGFRHRGEVESPDSCPASPDTYPGVQDDSRDLFKVSVSGGDETTFNVDYYLLNTSQSVGPAASAYTGDGRLEGIDLRVVTKSRDSVSSSLGIGFKRRELASRSIGERSSNEVYAFAQTEAWSSMARMRGSLRMEKNSRFTTEVAPTLIGWLFPRKGQCLYAKINRSYMYPSFDELYSNGPDVIGDPDLQTEHSNELEIGFLIDRGSLSLTAAVYWRDIDNMIVWRTDQSCGAYRYTNAEAKLKGLEFSLDFTHPYGIEGLASYSVNSETDESGGRVEYVPESVFAWILRARKDLSTHVAVGLTFAGRWVSSVNAGRQIIPCTTEPECLEDATLPDYTSGLLYAYVGIDRARVYTRVRNLFDDEIYTRWGRPGLPSRSYEFGISWVLRD